MAGMAAWISAAVGKLCWDGPGVETRVWPGKDTKRDQYGQADQAQNQGLTFHRASFRAAGAACDDGFTTQRDRTTGSGSLGRSMMRGCCRGVKFQFLRFTAFTHLTS